MEKSYTSKIFSALFIFFVILILYWNKSFFYYNYSSLLLNFQWMNITYNFGMDSISLFFVMLSILLLMVCVFLYWFCAYELNFYNFNVFFMLLSLMNLFFVKDMFLLFFFFELVILPLFFIVGMWGSSESKIYASYLLILYTLFGSIFALFSFIFIYSMLGLSCSFSVLNYISSFGEFMQILLFLFMFIAFSVKIPVVPFHMWLPEAHVEAPTPGSVMLAGIILKLGFYVYLRVLLFTFSSVNFFFISFIFILSVVGLYLSSFSALAQVDIKKIVAYSSISHMNFSLIGMFSANFVAMMGSFFMMFGHALVSSSLFSSIGFLYDSYKTSLFFYFGGLAILMPVWSTMFFIFILGNFSLPGTMNFVGEFIIFLGSFIASNFMILCCFFGLFMTLVYSLFLYVSLANGFVSTQYLSFFADMSRSEYWILVPLLLMTMLFGLVPNVFIDYYFSNLFYLYMH